MAGTFIETTWSWLEREHPWSLGPAGVFLLHQIVYFGCYIPYFVSDYVPYLRQYKIQPSKQNDRWSLWKCFKWLMFLHFVFELPIIVLTHPIFKGYLAAIRTDPPFPTLWTITWQIVAFYLIEDFYFYWIHRLLHWPPLYKRIHKVHHEHAAPFGIAGEYAHPIETMFLGVGTALGPVIFSTKGGMHLCMLYFWMIFRVTQVIDAHSGYNYPWSLNNLFPLWGGAEFHDFHHEKFTDNYASTFIIWDNVFGTNKKYLAVRAMQRHAKNKQM